MMTKRVLIIAPHPDDETLGVGGAIAKYTNDGCEVFVLVVSGHLPPLYKLEDYHRTVAESHKAFAILGVSNFKFLEMPPTMIANTPIHEFNNKIYSIVSQFKPNIVFCPYPDRHIDHRLVFDAVMVATRPTGVGKNIEILAAYETLSETHWNAPHIEPNFTPNWVIDISDFIDIKLKALKCYDSQISEFPSPRALESVKALAMFRGSQAGFAYGEGMHIIRKIN